MKISVFSVRVTAGDKAVVYVGDNFMMRILSSLSSLAHMDPLYLTFSKPSDCSHLDQVTCMHLLECVIPYKGRRT